MNTLVSPALYFLFSWSSKENGKRRWQPIRTQELQPINAFRKTRIGNSITPLTQLTVLMFRIYFTRIPLKRALDIIVTISSDSNIFRKIKVFQLQSSEVRHCHKVNPICILKYTEYGRGWSAWLGLWGDFGGWPRLKELWNWVQRREPRLGKWSNRE